MLLFLQLKSGEMLFYCKIIRVLFGSRVSVLLVICRNGYQLEAVLGPIKDFEGIFCKNFSKFQKNILTMKMNFIFYKM